MQKTNLLKLMIGITGACAFATAFAQEPAPTSTQTVDALLQAENKSVYERENPPRQTVRKNFDMAVQSIYGSESNMRADLMIGEKLQAGLSVGDKVGQYEIGLIEGRCVSLSCAIGTQTLAQRVNPSQSVWRRGIYQAKTQRQVYAALLVSPSTSHGTGGDESSNADARFLSKCTSASGISRSSWRT